MACWEKSSLQIPDEDSREPSTESVTEPSSDTSMEASIEPSTEQNTEELAFECADDLCQDGQYCYQFQPGVFDTAGLPDPYCERMPGECLNDYSCDCLINLEICTDCRVENRGIYCTFGAEKSGQ